MTNGDIITKIVEQDEDFFCILTNNVAETVIIELSLDWWNKSNAPTVDVLEQIRDEIIDRYPRNYANELELGGRSCVFSLNEILRIIDKYKTDRG